MNITEICSSKFDSTPTPNSPRLLDVSRNEIGSLIYLLLRLNSWIFWQIRSFLGLTVSKFMSSNKISSLAGRQCHHILLFETLRNVLCIHCICSTWKHNKLYLHTNQSPYIQSLHFYLWSQLQAREWSHSIHHINFFFYTSPVPHME